MFWRVIAKSVLCVTSIRQPLTYAVLTSSCARSLVNPSGDDGRGTQDHPLPRIVPLPSCCSVFRWVPLPLSALRAVGSRRPCPPLLLLCCCAAMSKQGAGGRDAEAPLSMSTMMKVRQDKTTTDKTSRERAHGSWIRKVQTTQGTVCHSSALTYLAPPPLTHHTTHRKSKC